MKIFDAKCKFCGVALKLQIDENYAALRDPFKLIPLAACNRCADYRVAKEKLLETMRRTAVSLSFGAIRTEENKAKVRERVTELLKRYMRLLADYRRMQVPPFEESLTDEFMNKPADFSGVLRRIGSVISQSELPLNKQLNQERLTV